MVNQYFYDNSGNRVRKVRGNVETKYFLRGKDILALQTGNEKAEFIYSEKGLPFAMKYQGQQYYYVLNQQGDVEELLDGNGTSVVQYSYNSWGKILSVQGSKKDTVGRVNPFRYRGYCYDEETGLYYLSSRYYDPEIGRFVNADDVELITESLNELTDKNLYNYCDNNSVVRKDKSGEFWVTVGIMAVGGVIGAVISAVGSIVTQEVSGGSINWKSVGVAAISGLIGGAIAASPLGAVAQRVAGTAIGGITYVADCYVNKKSVEPDELVVSAGFGWISGKIGGSGADEYMTLTNTINQTKKQISKMAKRKCTEYAKKRIASIKSYRTNKLVVSAWSTSLKFMAGCGISNLGSNRYPTIRKGFKTFISKFRWSIVS